MSTRAKREPTMGLAERLREMPDIIQEVPDVADWTQRDLDRLRAAADIVDQHPAAVARVAELTAEVTRLRRAAPHVDVPMIYAYELGLADAAAAPSTPAPETER